MIRLTRLNGQVLAVNCDLIKFVEQTHDTVLTLINNDKVVVRESLDEVIHRTLQFRRSILIDATAQYTGALTTVSGPAKDRQQENGE